MDGAFGAKRRKRKAVINITSLIDVMFLLLIFFMVSSTFKEHLGIDVTLPKANSASEQQSDQHEVVVRDDGRFFLGQKEVTPDGLRSALKALLAEEPEAVLTLRADEAASFQDVITAIDIARDVGGAQLLIPTQALPKAEAPTP